MKNIETHKNLATVERERERERERESYTLVNKSAVSFKSKKIEYKIEYIERRQLKKYA
jgi:hypothetical protein